MGEPVERKLYEAWRHGRGVRLSHGDLCRLLHDDAMQTRICNAAAMDAGFSEPGDGGDFFKRMPWKKLGKYFDVND